MTTQISFVSGVDFVRVPTSDVAGAMDFYVTPGRGQRVKHDGGPVCGR